ncbi:MAG TPA: MFS transporter [Streptosporangiaceae bacterium]|nr:MFS transporter [Streptosporangiaceae bacterium]
MTATAAPPASIPLTAYKRRWYMLGVLCLSLLVIVVDSTIVNVALPTLARQLNASASGLQWIVDAYTLTFAALLLLAGAIADRYGRHYALAGGLVIFAVGSLAAAFTGTAAELIAARAAMGVGGAFIMPATLSIITNVFTDHAERTKAIGLWSAVSGLGVAIGPVAGGWLLAHFSWGSIFLVNLPIVAVALVAGYWLIPASRSPRADRLDLTGAALSVAALTVLTYTIIEAPDHGWLSVTTLGLFAASVVLLAVFAIWEARSDHPMLPLHLFRNPRFSGAGVSITVMFFALAGVVFLSTQIYQFVLGYSPLAAGVRALPSAAALAIFSPVGAQMAKRFGELVPISLGLAAVTGGLALFATATAASGYGHYVLAMVIVSSGIGMAMSPATSASMRELPPAMAGVGSAVNDTTRNMGSVLGVAVFGSITASVFASRMAQLAHGSIGSVGAAAEVAHHVGGAYGTALMHVAASAFVAGADHAVIAGAIATAVGVLVAFRTLRARRPTPATAPVTGEVAVPAEVLVPAEMRMPEPARG